MKMYVVLRSDIYMDAGKAAAQAGHAFAHVSMKAQAEYAERFWTYQPDAWIVPGTKVVLGASYKEIKQIESECSEKGLPFWTMWDNGHKFPPDFDGKHEVLTAIGIGPLFREESDDLLGHLKLFAMKKLRRKKKR